MSNKTFNWLLLGVTIFGMLTICYTTYWGVGLLDWDSFNYISTARNLANGLGYVIPLNNETLVPMTHFPPMLPSILAIFENLKIDAIIAARILNITLFGASIALIGITIQEITKSYYFSLLASLLFALSSALIEIHSWALSEPLLLFITSLGLLLYYKYSQNARFLLLVISGICLSFAFLTKYAGAANIGTVLLAILLLKNASYTKKIKAIALVSFISILPMIGWTARNYSLTETINNRGLGYYPLSAGNIINGLQTFFSWYFPEFLLLESKQAWLTSLILIVLILMISLSIFLWKNHKPEIIQHAKKMQFDCLSFTYALFTVIYILVILTAKTFFDPKIGMSNRMFAPVLLSSLVLLISGLHNLWRLSNRWGKTSVIMLSVYLILFSSIGSYNKITDLHDNGLGLNREEIQSSEAIQLLEELAGEMTIYNNYSFAMYLRTGQMGYKFNQIQYHTIPTEGVIFAVFKSKSPETHPIVARFQGKLELLADDMIATVYIYIP